ncbi:MAG: hypothetical protein RLZZ117_2479 [Cyanobacteriota bacterium]
MTRVLPKATTPSNSFSILDLIVPESDGRSSSGDGIVSSSVEVLTGQPAGGQSEAVALSSQASPTSSANAAPPEPPSAPPPAVAAVSGEDAPLEWMDPFRLVDPPAPGDESQAADAAPAPSSASASAPTPAPVLFSGPRLLVQWLPAATESERAEALVALGAVRKELIQTAPMKARGEGFLEVVQLPTGANLEAALAHYGANPAVRFAEVDQLLGVQAISNDPEYSNSQLWGMYGADSPTAVGPIYTTNPFGSNAEAAWNLGFTGSSSVFVGILDQGIDYRHEDLAANLWLNPFELEDGIDNDGNGYIDDIRGWNFLDDNNLVFDFLFDDHGTHVAGTIGGIGGNGTGVVGVNWDVTMIPAKFLDTAGGYISGAILALDYITDLKWRHGLNIVATNNSWTAFDTALISAASSRAMQEAIVRSARQDILFVASAGNQASNNDLAPSFPSLLDTTLQAGYDAVVSVAAIDSQGRLASFSNFGPTTVDLGAPGVDIFSTFPWDYYDLLSGTSMAAPHVTGAIALYASRYPGSTGEQIRAALLASTTPTTSLENITASGGRLNVLDFLNTPPPPAFSIQANQPHRAEGQADVATPFTFTITRHGSTTGEDSVSWAVAGSGPAPADALDFAGQALPSGTLTFAPGISTQTITVWANPDTLPESDEAFAVSLLQASPGALLTAGRASATASLLNDDGVILAINSAPLTIPSQGSALPSLSSLTVSSGSADPITSVEVTLYNLYHSSLDDVDILLVGPTGETTLLMSDVGGFNSVDGITLTFSAQASETLPDDALVTTGRWKPTNHVSPNDDPQTIQDTFDSLAPAGPHAADLTVFNGTNPDGVWSLFVRDDTAAAAGKILDGWSLAITTQPVVNSVSLAVSPERVQEDGEANLIYTFSRTGSLQNPLSVQYSVSGTATPDVDFTGIPSLGSVHTVTFAAGSATAVVVVDPVADTIVEAPETVSLTLVEGSGYTIETPAAVVGVIDDDDTLMLDRSGDTRLSRDAGNRLFVQQGDAAPVGLRFRNRPILQTSFPGWEPLAAETFDGVNQMIWRNIPSNNLSLWTMDSNWSWSSTSGEWGMNSPGAQLQESRFGVDFNGNGTIG